MDDQRLDAVRRAALDAVDTAEVRLRRIVLLAALMEAVLLTTFLVLMDFSNRLHWLILVAALLVYSTLAIGLVALGAHGQKNSLRILKALELAQPDR